jgi:hypothetical protein
MIGSLLARQRALHPGGSAAPTPLPANHRYLSGPPSLHPSGTLVYLLQPPSGGLA